MAKIDLARRAEIGRARRAKTRSQILEAAAMLLGDRPVAAVTVDSVVEAAGVAKGTFYYHFKSMDELAAAVGTTLAESFDDLLAPAMGGLPDPIARLSFAFTKFLERAMADPAWARLVIQSTHAPTEFGPGIRAHINADIAHAIAEKRVTVEDVELAADIVIGIWLQVIRGALERRPAANLANQALDAMLRALGVRQ